MIDSLSNSLFNSHFINENVSQKNSFDISKCIVKCAYTTYVPLIIIMITNYSDNFNLKY